MAAKISSTGNVISLPKTINAAKTLREAILRNQGWEAGPVDRERNSAHGDGRRVLILDPAADHALSIVGALQARGISATTFQTKQRLLQFLEKRGIDMAVIVLHSKSCWRNELRMFCNSIRYFQENAEIICVLTWPEECPLDRLYGDTLNVMVLHG